MSSRQIEILGRRLSALRHVASRAGHQTILVAMRAVEVLAEGELASSRSVAHNANVEALTCAIVALAPLEFATTLVVETIRLERRRQFTLIEPGSRRYHLAGGSRCGAACE